MCERGTHRGNMNSERNDKGRSSGGHSGSDNPRGQHRGQKRTRYQDRRPDSGTPRPRQNGSNRGGNQNRYPQPQKHRPPLSDSGYQSILNITNLAVIAILIGLIIFFLKILSVFGIFIISFIIAFLLYPMVDWFAARRIPRVWSILIVYLIIGAILFAISAAVVPAAITQVNEFISQLPNFAENFKTQLLPRLQTFQDFLQRQGMEPEQIQNYIDQSIPTIQEWLVTLGKRLAVGLQGAMGNVVAAFSVPIIVFYLLLDAPKIRNSLMGLVPRRTAGEVQFLLNELADMLNHYLRGQIKLSFIIFSLSCVGLFILGVPHALILATLGGLTEVIPIAGPLIAFIPAFFIAVFSDWTYGLGFYLPDYWLWKGIIITCFYLLLQWSENNLIVPRVMGKNLNLHPLTVMFSLLAGGVLGGIFGMLIALPIAACLKVVFGIYYRPFIEKVEELVRSRSTSQASEPERPTPPSQ